MQPAYSGQPETEAFAVKLNPAGGYVYSTYSGRNGFRRGYGVAADAAGNAYLTGSNALRRLDAAGALVIPSRTLGGEGRSVALDAEGGVYVGGITTTTAASKCATATQFCPTPGALQQNPGGSTNDGFVIKFEGEEDTVEIAGLTFPRTALADDAVQTKAGIDASAQFCSRIDYTGTTIPQRVKSALTDGCEASSTLGDAEFEVSFTDNRVVNLAGADLAVFEVGSGAGNEPFSVSVFYNGQFTAPVTYTPTPTTFFDCANLRINVARIDLDDFGLPAGAQLSRLRFDNLFVPNVVSSGADIADIAAIHSAPPNAAPAADAGPDQLIEATAQTTSVILDGSASADPDGDALAYEWRDPNNNVVGNDALVNLQLPLGTHTFTLRVDDGKGGTDADAVTVEVRDTTPPEINVVTPAQGATYTVGQPVAADYACTDAASAVVTCAGTAPDGGAVDTATVGTKSFTVIASDEAGNTATKTVTYNVGFGVCALYDQTKAHKSGSTVPVRLQLCGPNGENLSAEGITVTALGTVRLSDFAPGEVEDSGHANPDDNFRFAGDRYVFNLQTTGLTTGTYALVFKAGADPMTHGVQFQIK